MENNLTPQAIFAIMTTHAGSPTTPYFNNDCYRNLPPRYRLQVDYEPYRIDNAARGGRILRGRKGDGFS
jgi:hypothetical protein